VAIGIPDLLTMAANEVTVYLGEEDFGQHGCPYVETDTAAAEALPMRCSCLAQSEATHTSRG
jgi:hypothetical protein